MTNPGDQKERADLGDHQPPDPIRRRDRAKDDAWIRAFLTRAPFGVLATVRAGRPFLNSNLFVLDGDALFLHTARTGRTPENVAAGGPAAFTAASIGRFLPADEALEFSVEYAAAEVFGRVGPVMDPAEKRRVLDLVMRKYAPHLEPGRDYRPITAGELRRTGVHRLDIESWTGKENAAPKDVPGAYLLPVPISPSLELPSLEGGSMSDSRPGELPAEGK